MRANFLARKVDGGSRRAPLRCAIALFTVLNLVAISAATAQTPAPQTVPAAVPRTAAPATAATAADDSKIRVWAHKGYGRIVFDRSRPSEHRAKLMNRALTISFDHAIDDALDDIPARLGAYAAAARKGEDGRSVLLTLKPGVRFKTFASGNSVVVDLMPAAEASAAAAGASPAVPVRVGAHATFTRLVFDWSRAVEYSLAGESPRFEIRFGKSAAIDVAAINRALPPLIRSAATRRTDVGTNVTLAVAEGAELRHFRTGMSVVVDVVRGIGAPKTKAAQRPRTATPGKSTAGEKPAAVKRASKVAPKSAATPAMPSRADSLAPTPQGSVAMFDLQGKAVNPIARQLMTRDTVVPATAQQGAGSSPVSLLPSATAVTSASAVPVLLKLEPAAAVMKFHWAEEVGAAVFERGGHLWAVFDREARLAFEGWDEALAKPSPNSKRRQEERPAAAFIARPQFSAMPGTTVFRMRIPNGVNPRVTRDKAAWVVTLEREYLRPASGVAVESHLAAAAGARLFIAQPDAGQAVAIGDPEVGDRIWVVPLAAPERGIGLARQFAEVELFATAQGIAGRALSDDVAFRTLPKGVEIAARQGLTLSGAGRVDIAGAKASDVRPGQTRPGWLFDYDSWKRESLGTFVQNKHVLLREAATAPPTTRNARRLDLAQLNFAYDNLTDVLGLLEVIEQDEPELAQEPVFRAMRGAAYYRLGDYEKAARDLGHNSLDPFKESALWRAALAAANDDWTGASRFFSRAETVLRAYPAHLRQHFGRLAAEAALNIGDVGLAKFHLDTLDGLSPDRAERAQINYLRGRLLAKVLEPEGAIAAWTKAIEGPDRRMRVLATIARTDLQLEKEKISKADAAKELEKLRFAWRGDDLEFTVLMRLGRAYLDIADYKNGLMTLRDLATNFPKHADADKVIDAMRAAFVKLYVEGAADKVPPLTALALYDEFRELTPEGPVGDKLIFNLAERLVSVDLLDRAASLLAHLVDRRLRGIDRFDAANRLALVYLLDRKPQQALEALAGEIPTNLIPQLAAARRHFKARALADLARYKDGLALIASDTSLEAEVLRGETYWRLRDWTNASVSYARIVKMTVKANSKDANGELVEAALDDEAQRNVLSLAIAYALSRNQDALRDVRQIYIGRMSKGIYKESFDVVTAPSGIVADDYRVISRKVAEVDQFRSFLSSYRGKLLSRGAGTAPAPAPTPGPSASAASAPPG